MGDAELQFCWDASWLETAYTFPPPKGLQGGAALRRKLQLLCLGLTIPSLRNAQSF